jgi:hypothetical protein
METQPTPQDTSRLGFHYFPDTSHYTEGDLRAWIPELRSLGASWLVLKAPANRAIPEVFITGLLAAEVQPILHFHLPLSSPLHTEEISLLFESYAHWGVHYAVLFDRPNRRRSWAEKDWAQVDLVERFLDIFLPAANASQEAGLTPVFPPLEPGGDYWDTAFFRSALQGIQRRGNQDLIRELSISAYAWPDNLPLDWGAGGPERWPGARPYVQGKGSEDQRGFRIFDWYLAICRAVFGSNLPILLLGTGCQIGARRNPQYPIIDETIHTERNIAIFKSLMGNDEIASSSASQDKIPDDVVAGCLWLLAADDESPHIEQAWFRPGGKNLPIVGVLRELLAGARSGGANGAAKFAPGNGNGVVRPIAHYLLLPSYEWGIADWHLEAARSYIKQHRPTVGFSLVEAAQSTYVSVLGDEDEFTDEVLDELRSAGCVVERIEENGTSIAS